MWKENICCSPARKIIWIMLGKSIKYNKVSFTTKKVHEKSESEIKRDE